MTDKPPPLPNVQAIPDPLLAQWIEIPTSDALTVNVTRNDIDQLFFAINNLISAQHALQELLVFYSNGNLDEANDNMDRARRWSIESTNSLRSFFSGIIAGEMKTRAAKK